MAIGLTRWWRENLVDEGRCAVCANTGIFKSAVSGRSLFCLCPNGRGVAQLARRATRR